MKRLIFLFIIILSICSCNTAKNIIKPVVLKDSVRIVERLVPVQLPADSSYIDAFFECDSTNQVIMKSLSEEKSKRINSEFNFTSGKVAKLDYKSKVKPDTVYISVKDTSVIKDKPVYVNVPVVTNQLIWWQKVFMWEGVALNLLLLLAIYKKIKL